MRRRFLPGLLAAALLFLPACSGAAADASISPDLTESTQDVLEAFGMAGTASLLSFQGPEEDSPPVRQNPSAWSRRPAPAAS